MSDIPGLTKYFATALTENQGIAATSRYTTPDTGWKFAVYLASDVEARDREIIALLKKVAMPDQGVIRSADPDPIRILSAVLTVMNATRDEAQRLLARLT